MSKLITRSAHGSGATCLSLSKDGSRAYTGGQDCIVRIWKMDEGSDQEPVTALEAEQAITAVIASDTCWLSGSEDAVVRQYVRDTPEFTGHVWDAKGLSIRSLAIDPTGKRVAITSDELEVQVVNLEDITIASQLKGHRGSVRRASWHPTSSLLTTSGSDGKIIIWNMSAEEPRIEATIEDIIPTVGDSSSPEYAHDSRAVWHHSGQYFYVASRTHEIITISRSDWSKTSSFSDKNVSGPITALGISINSVYIASACGSKVYVWSTQTKRVIASHAGTPGATITHLEFSPKENVIAWTDNEGIFSRWPDAIPDSFPDPVRRAGAASTAAQLRTSLFDDTAEAANAAAQKPEDNIIPEDAFADIDDDWIIDDLGGALKDAPEGGRKNDAFVKEMVSITKAQPPFQPSSTPMDNRKRYLAYNMLGVIEVTDQDTHHIVNVEFFDRSARKGYHFTDHFKYDLGYLGERGAVFACPPEDAHPAQVYYKPHSMWNNTNEWTYVLKRPQSSVLGVAAGGVPSSGSLRQNNDHDLQGYGNVVIATSEGDLTFLSGTGRERRILGLGGDFVSMVAGPDWVFVVHRNGSTTIDGSQNLSYSIINYEDFSVKQRDVLPIPKGHVLKWLGLTDQGAPAIYDSAGWVHVLTKFRIPHHASWARVMDANLLERRQGKDESYWPVGITESNLMCLILKGRQENPGFPRPLIQELPIRMPFRREEPKEELIEREMLLTQIALDSLDDELTTDEIVQREHLMDKEFILLIQAACKADNIPRAIELTKLLHHTTSFEHAMKIADFYHLVGLKEKIGLLKADREENEDRLVAARNKRRKWLKPDPPLREVRTAYDSGGISSKKNLLGDTRPPPAVERPGLARVRAPVIENTRFTSVTPSPAPILSRELSAFPDETELSSQTSPGDCKRKRAETDDLPPFTTPLPKKTNPFTRKPGQELRNPFARKQDPSGKTIQKSESFFDKVGTAEADAANGHFKRPFAKSANNTVTRQTTLFGLPPPEPKEKENGKGKKSTKAQRKDDNSQMSENAGNADVVMSDAASVLDLDTQDTQGGDGIGIVSWEETQLVETGSEPNAALELLQETDCRVVRHYL